MIKHFIAHNGSYIRAAKIIIDLPIYNLLPEDLLRPGSFDEATIKTVKGVYASDLKQFGLNGFNENQILYTTESVVSAESAFVGRKNDWLIKLVRTNTAIVVGINFNKICKYYYFSGFRLPVSSKAGRFS